MKKDNSNRTRIIGLRLSPEEYTKIEKRWKASTCRKLSDYVRRHLFDRPVVTTYRNQSADDALAELTRLRTELNHIGNNFNQAVKKLHTLDRITEFKSWLVAYEADKNALLGKIDAIKEQVLKMASIWLQ